MTEDPVTAPTTTEERSLVQRAEAQADGVAARFDKSDWIELLAALLLALATIAAAWCAYQSTRWSGQQADLYGQASAAREESVRASNQYFALAVIDVQVFQSWISAKNAGDDRLAAFWRERFRAEFVPAFDAWLASAPSGTIPPGTPFALSQYQPEQKTSAAALGAQAENFTAEARRANQTGDDFVLLAVIFASVLFFAGIGTRFKGYRVRVLMVGFAVVLFGIALVFVFSLPQSIGV